MRKVITYTDKDYFEYGEFFLKTRHKVNAKVICYGHELTHDQKRLLQFYDVEHKPVPYDFHKKMQFLKFQLMLDEIARDECDLVTFMDFDTIINKDWGDEVVDFGPDLGITVRDDYVKKGLLRGFANGGVIFSNGSARSMEMLRYCIKVMEKGGAPELPEYDTIFKTLEEGRPAHKTHKRDTLRWWVDQVLLSSFVLRYTNHVRLYSIGEPQDYEYRWKDDMDPCQIVLFPCERFNRLDPSPKNFAKDRQRKIYIFHLKSKGREVLDKFRKMIK